MGKVLLDTDAVEPSPDRDLHQATPSSSSTRPATPPSPTTSTIPPPAAEAHGLTRAAAQLVAERVVSRMYSYDHLTAGPNSWLDDVAPDLTGQAHGYYLERLGPGAGATSSLYWQTMIEQQGHQYVTAGPAHLDPVSEGTNTRRHLTLLVPYVVDVAGVESSLAIGDRLVYVNLEARGERWVVSAVMPPSALPADYSTFRLN